MRTFRCTTMYVKFLFFIFTPLTHNLLEFLMCTAFSQVVIPPVASEWDTFFKLHAFEMYLVPSISMVIHFSTSVYSKLIITCSARPQCLNMACSIKGKFIWLYAKETSKSVIKFTNFFLKFLDYWSRNKMRDIKKFVWKIRLDIGVHNLIRIICKKDLPSWANLVLKIQN